MIGNNLVAKTKATCISAFCLFFLTSCWQGYSQDTREDRSPVTTADSLQLLSLHNQVRSNGIKCGRSKMPRVKELRWSTQLALVAQQHSNEMANRNKLSHLDKQKENAGNRLNAQGYNWLEYGENLAYGVFNAQNANTLWLNSPKHCRNMMQSSFTEMGAGNIDGYWTVVFARPK